MKNSLILSFFGRAFGALKYWFENSLYFKIWTAILNFFGGFYKRSFTDFLFGKERTTQFAANSFFVRIIGKIVSVLDFLVGKPCRFFAKKIAESTICRAVKFLLKNWQYISIRYFSVFIFAFGCTSGAIDSAIHGFISNRWIAITLCGALGCLVKGSFSELVTNEFIIKFFNIKLFENPHLLETNSQNSLAFSIIFGAAFGAMWIVPYMQLTVILIAALVILVLNPRCITFMAVILLPFLPTMAVVGLMLFSTVICFVAFISQKDKSFKFDGFDLAVSGLLFMNIYGVLISETPAASAKIAAVYIAFILFFFVLRRYLANAKRFFVTLDWFITAAAAVAGYGIIEQIFGLSKTTWQDEEMFEEIAGRAVSTFENPNVLGEYFLLTIPLTIARMFSCKTSKGKLLCALSGVLQIICMVFTYSRGCWLGIMFAMVIFFALCGKKLFVFMTVGVFALPFVIPQSIIDRLLSIGNTADTSTAYRVFIWEGTCRMLQDTWLYGIGLGTDAFNSIYPRYALGAITAPHPHNLYLLILAETGLIGALMVGAVLLMYFRSTGRICRQSSEHRTLGVAFAAAMGGYLLQGMFDNVWYNYRIYALFIMILAFAAALRDIAEVRKND